MTDTERELLEANSAFYSAFARRDLKALEELWSHDAPVACVHPGWEPLRSRDQVLKSFENIFVGGGAPATILCVNATPHVLGPYAAFVICLERVPGGDLAATNLFVREGGKYRLVHHHSAPVARRQQAPGGGGPGPNKNSPLN